MEFLASTLAASVQFKEFELPRMEVPNLANLLPILALLGICVN
jgi:hypothetical protein